MIGDVQIRKEIPVHGSESRIFISDGRVPVRIPELQQVLTSCKWSGLHPCKSTKPVDEDLCYSLVTLRANTSDNPSTSHRFLHGQAVDSSPGFPDTLDTLDTLSNDSRQKRHFIEKMTVAFSSMAQSPP